MNREKLCKQFGTRSLKGFGVDHFTSGLSAAGAILYYLEFTEHRDIAHITSISRIDQEDYVWVDKFTIRNLELFSSNGAREKCSFADVIDRTLTPMGGRLLKRWIAMPIKDPVKIGGAAGRGREIRPGRRSGRRRARAGGAGGGIWSVSLRASPRRASRPASWCS